MVSGSSGVNHFQDGAHKHAESRVINEYTSAIRLMRSDGLRMNWNNNLGEVGEVIKGSKEVRAKSFT